MNEIITHSLARHIQALKEKQYSAEELTRALLDQIGAEDPKINSFITVDHDRAIKAAKESDERRASGIALSALDGIPYAAKDNISTCGLATTCGSRILKGYVPPYNATVIDRLTSSGAVLLGKTNMDEFAMGVSTETSCFGATLNPLDLSRVAGGSSGGSAAAVSAFNVPFTLGSDTGGSVRQPAAFCGIVGMRPTYGCVSRYGLVSFAPSLDIIGPLTADVTDNVIAINAILGIDSKDMTSVAHPEATVKSPVNGVRGMRIAILKDIQDRPVSATVARAISKSADILRYMGADVSEISLPHVDSAYAAYYTIGCAEASSNLSRFDGVRYGMRANGYNDTEELYRLSRSNGFGNEVKRRILFGTMALSSEYVNDFYRQAVNMRGLISHELCNILSDADAILLPTAPTEAYTLGQASTFSFESGIDDIYCALASLAGLPAISLPYREKDALPVGVQLIGRAFGESALYRIAYSLESAFGGKTNG